MARKGAKSAKKSVGAPSRRDVPYISALAVPLGQAGRPWLRTAGRLRAWIVYGAGGGGCGDSLKGDPMAAYRDVAQGYVSIERARESFGVIIDRTAMKADLAAAGRLRASKTLTIDG